MKGAKSGRWFIYNVLYELDQPGEYVIDRANKMLYFIPPENITNTHVSIWNSVVNI